MILRVQVVRRFRLDFISREWPNGCCGNCATRREIRVPAKTLLVLTSAIVLEVLGTSMLQRSAQFTKLLPTLAMLVCYAGSFYMLSHVLKTMPLGLAYAIWSGLGIVLVAAVGYFAFNQKLDLAAVIGLGLIVAGVLVVNLLSNSATH